MEYLNKKQFRNYVKNIEIVVNTDLCLLNDEYDTFCSYDPINSNNNEILNALIDGVEYKFTESQKNKLYEIAHDTYKKETSLAEPFNCNDYAHFLSLINS